VLMCVDMRMTSLYERLFKEASFLKDRRVLLAHFQVDHKQIFSLSNVKTVDFRIFVVFLNQFHRHLVSN
jgi:hypothetical protein